MITGALINRQFNNAIIAHLPPCFGDLGPEIPAGPHAGKVLVNVAILDCCEEMRALAAECITGERTPGAKLTITFPGQTPGIITLHAITPEMLAEWFPKEEE